MPSQSVDPRTGTAFGPVFEDTSPDRAGRGAGGGCVRGEVVGRHQRRRTCATCCGRSADALDADADALVELADRETGLGVAAADRRAGADDVPAADVRRPRRVRRATRPRGRPRGPGSSAGGSPRAAAASRVPLGPVAVFGASNFPFAFSVPGGDTASALAAGCPVVVKAHPAHPQTSQRCGELDRLRARGRRRSARCLRGRPRLRGRTAVGDGPAASALRRSPAPGAGGRALFDAAVGRPDPIPFYGELGSVNPVVVTPAAASDPEPLVGGWLASLTLGGGQFCTNPGLLLAPRGSGVAEQVRTQTPASPPPCCCTTASASTSTRAWRSSGPRPGAEVLAVGASPGDGGVTRQVTVIAVPAESALDRPDLLATECFGPVGVLVEYGDRDELLALLDTLPGCLVGTVHGSPDEPLAAEAVQALSRIAGRVVWNGWPTGVAVTAGQHHGGPWPATTNPLHTSVGTAAIDRFTRPVAFQAVPQTLLSATAARRA